MVGFAYELEQLQLRASHYKGPQWSRLSKANKCIFKYIVARFYL